MADQVERLPQVYTTFLVLQGAGMDDAGIARHLDVPVDSLPLLARLAEAKLARLRAHAEPTSDESSGPPADAAPIE